MSAGLPYQSGRPLGTRQKNTYVGEGEAGAEASSAIGLPPTACAPPSDLLRSRARRRLRVGRLGSTRTETY